MAKQLKLPQFVRDFMDVFRDSGYDIFVVGGPVRDLILDRSIDNWDFASSATPEEVVDLFDNAKYENNYGTVIVPYTISDNSEDKKIIMEVTPFRKESEYSDRRHPDSIEWADSIEEDVKRRDFTINALAYDGEELVDIVGGYNDIQEGVIKTVGDPHKRFSEDALRLLRAVRFSTQLGFDIEDDTLEAIQANAEHITEVSWERIRDEFMKIIASENAADGIMMLRETGLLQYILPEVDNAFGVGQKSPQRHHELDVGSHLIETLRHCPSDDPITRLAALLHDVGKTDTREVDPETGVVTFYNHEIVGTEIANDIAERLRLSKKDREKLTKLVRYHMFSVSDEQTDKAVRRFIRRVGKEHIQDMYDLRTGDRVGSGVPESSWRTELFKKRVEEVQKEPFTVHDLKISGDDIMEELDLKPGPEIGRILHNLFEKVENKEIPNTKEALMAELEKME